MRSILPNKNTGGLFYIGKKVPRRARFYAAFLQSGKTVCLSTIQSPMPSLSFSCFTLLSAKGTIGVRGGSSGVVGGEEGGNRTEFVKKWILLDSPGK